MTAAGAAIAIRAQPGARREAVLGVAPAMARPGWPEARLRIAVAAPPEEGHANAAILRLLAAELGVKPGACRLVQGLAAREKLVAVTGEAAALEAALAALSRRVG